MGLFDARKRKRDVILELASPVLVEIREDLAFFAVGDLDPEKKAASGAEWHPANPGSDGSPFRIAIGLGVEDLQFDATIGTSRNRGQHLPHSSCMSTDISRNGCVAFGPVEVDEVVPGGAARAISSVARSSVKSFPDVASR